MIDDLNILMDKILYKALELSPIIGWNKNLITYCCDDLEISITEFNMIFVSGIQSLINYFISKVDTAMSEKYSPDEPIHVQVFYLLSARFIYMNENKQAVNKMVKFMAFPSNFLASSKSTWNTADKVWNLVEHKSAGFDYYTRRAILVGVYSSSIIYFSNHSLEETLDFLKSKLKSIGKIGKIKKQIFGRP